MLQSTKSCDQYVLHINTEAFDASIPPKSICTLLLLLNALTFLLCLTMVILVKRFIVDLVSALAPSAIFVLSFVLTYESPLEAVLQSFQLLILYMPSALFVCARLTMQSR